MIKQVVKFPISPGTLYEILLDSNKHSVFTQSQAVIDPTVGGTFSVYDGYAEGKNIELIPGQKIVQSWRANDWPDNIYSTVTFSFKSLPQGTELTFTQVDIPTDYEADVAQGWQDFYWQPLIDYLKQSTIK
jgi:activator of HSP90 ATPase